MFLESKCFIWSVSIESSSFGFSQLKAKPFTITAMAPNEPLEQPRLPSSFLLCCAQRSLAQIHTSDPPTCLGTEQGTALLPLTTVRGLQMRPTLQVWGWCWWHKWHAVHSPWLVGESAADSAVPQNTDWWGTVPTDTGSEKQHRS